MRAGGVFVIVSSHFGSCYSLQRLQEPLPCLLQALHVGCRLSAHSAALGTCMVLLTVLQEPVMGPLLSGAARRPCCCRLFRVGCPLPAHSTVLGNVYISTHSTSGDAGNCKPGVVLVLEFRES